MRPQEGRGTRGGHRLRLVIYAALIPNCARPAPDYPFINSSYNDVATAFDRVFGAIRRFAGEGVFTYAFVGHWLPISKDGCRALKDRGVKLAAESRREFIFIEDTAV